MSLCISTVGGDSRQYYMLLRLFTYFSRICQPVLIKCYGLNISPEQQTGLLTCYHDSILFCSGLPEAVKGADLLICPAPFTRDGIHLNLSDRANSVSISELSDLKHLPAFIAGGGFPKHFSNSVKSRTLLKDYMKDSDFLNTNSTLTAEGLLLYYPEYGLFHLRIPDLNCRIWPLRGTNCRKTVRVISGNFYL